MTGARLITIQAPVMKKEILLILTYTLVVVVFVIGVKLMQTYGTHSQIIHECQLADCGDPPPTPSPGE